MTAFTGKTFQSKDGLRLYYRDYSGPSAASPVVLCLPGLTRNGRDFEDVADHLSQKYRVLCADLRGRGRSAYADDPMTYQPPTYVEDVVRLLDAAGIDKAVFIGTSLGGLVSMFTATLHRDRVRAIVLNDVGPEIEPAGLDRIRGYVGKQSGYADWAAATASVKTLNAHVYPKWSDAEWELMTRRLCAPRDDGKIYTDYDARIAMPFNQEGPVAHVDLWPMFAGLKGIPLLALRGALSDIISQKTLDKMAATLPDMNTVLVPDVGHAPYLMEPDARAAIDAFLAKL
ncbi:MAG: alpha/beta hydrolase [Rhodobacteraceae bacterium]|nr:alpha/beta hydrolase [Paracoccaceae bacterium]